MKITPENRQKVLLVVTLIVGGIFAADKLIIGPFFAGWKERGARIVELRKTISQGQQMIERDKTIRGRWNDMLANTLSNEVSLAESQMLKAFDRWSQESRISITSIKPQWRQNNEDYQTLECRVDAYGNLGSVSRFLYEVEKDPMALKVEVVELTARENDGSQMNLALQVSGLMLTPNAP